jgi:HEPN domain-containing protein
MLVGLKELIMYCGEYAPWDHYPKNLRVSEILNPMSVVNNFFSADRVKGHSVSLKEWRDFVISENHYSHPSDGPGVLVFTCGQNLELLEAMYLLLIQYEADWGTAQGVSAEQLNNEKEQWEFFPNNLSIEELKEPYKVVKVVFNNITPQQYRDYLNDWLYFALINFPNDESIEAGEIISVYENIIKLYSAAWIIYKRNNAETILRDERRDECAITKSTVLVNATISNSEKEEVSFISRTLTPADKLGLKEVISLILKNEPKVKAIFHLGTVLNPFTYLLYILIDEQKFYLNYEINQKIEDLSKSLVPLFVMMDSANVMQDADGESLSFFNYVSKKGSVIYRSNDINIPDSTYELAENTNSDSNEIYQWWKNQSESFYKIAKYPLEDHNCNMALYFLHQALEMSLLGLLEVKVGFSTTIPNLQRLTKMTLLFTEKVTNFFETLAAEDNELQHLISESHIKRLISKAGEFFILVDGLLQ